MVNYWCSEKLQLGLLLENILTVCFESTKCYCPSVVLNCFSRKSALSCIYFEGTFEFINTFNVNTVLHL